MTDREIFIKAPLDGPPEALETYLAEACGGDEELEAKVRELIAEAGEVDEFMERAPLGESAPPTVDGADLVEGAGSTIGNYKLLQQTEWQHGSWAFLPEVIQKTFENCSRSWFAHNTPALRLRSARPSPMSSYLS